MVVVTQERAGKKDVEENQEKEDVEEEQEEEDTEVGLTSQFEL